MLFLHLCASNVRLDKISETQMTYGLYLFDNKQFRFINQFFLIHQQVNPKNKMVANNASVFLQTLIFVMNQSNFQQDSSYSYYFLEIGKSW